MILLLAAALSSWTVPLPEGYDATVAPSLVACTSEPTRVHAEMHLTKVHTMDEKKETISIEGYLRLRWNDQRLAAGAGRVRNSEEFVERTMRWRSTVKTQNS